MSQDIHISPFGETTDGQQVKLFTFTNQQGVEFSVTNFGGTVISLKVPDRTGRLGDIVLCFDNLADIEAKRPFYGCIVGRYGNRIANGRFSLDGKTYTLAINNGPNHLHGGIRGFDLKVWDAETFSQEGARGVILTTLSPDGEEGYPGNLLVKVTYTLTDDNSLDIDYEATTDAPTVVNLTNHMFFNLKDCGATPVYDHQMQIFADHFTPVDQVMIPTGEIRPVAGSALDFTLPKTIGQDIDSGEEQLVFGNGYDHNFVINRKKEGLVRAARVSEPDSGRVMEVWTTEPGVQFYSANYLSGRKPGKYGIVYEDRTGFCLETQHYPDSPNKPGFPDTVLRPGEVYSSRTRHVFSVE